MTESNRNLFVTLFLGVFLHWLYVFFTSPELGGATHIKQFPSLTSQRK